MKSLISSSMIPCRRWRVGAYDDSLVKKAFTRGPAPVRSPPQAGAEHENAFFLVHHLELAAAFVDEALDEPGGLRRAADLAMVPP
jgi:hypothetical protein